MSRIRRLSNLVFSRGLFGVRWLMAPFYVGLAIALGALLVVFLRELFVGLAALGSMTAGGAILMVLALIDVTLIANLILIVTLAGYENFVARIESGGQTRPSWMGTIDFTGMKMKLMGSITAISAIALLRAFMLFESGGDIDDKAMRWMVVIHIVLMGSVLLLAISDWISAVTQGLPPAQVQPPGRSAASSGTTPESSKPQ